MIQQWLDYARQLITETYEIQAQARKQGTLPSTREQACIQSNPKESS